MNQQNLHAGKNGEVYLTHSFDAPREMVFEAWTDPRQLATWFAPANTHISFKKADVRTGGSYHSCIHDPIHGECWCKGTYLEVTYPEKLVYTIELTDADGRDLSPSQTGKGDDWPVKSILTVIFTELHGQTELSLHQTVPAVLAQQTGALPSWISMLGNLRDLLDRRNAGAPKTVAQNV